MTTGTTSGASSTPKIRRRNGKRARQNPKAASVPRDVAISIAPVPTIRLFFSDGSQRSEVKKSWYQRNDAPGSGKCRNDPAENDNGTMTPIGAIRKNSTRPATNHKP